MPLSSIEHDEQDIDIDDAAEALLRKWTTNAEQKPDAEERPARPERTHQEPEEEEEEAPSEEETDDEEHEEEVRKPRRAAEDDDEVVVSVDGEEHRIAVKDLKRLFGQEASLTRKSQEVATLRTQAQAQAERHVAALHAMIGRAQEKLKPFANVDWALAAARMSTEDYQQLRQAHDALKADADYYQTELDNTVKGYREGQAQQVQKAAEACVAALTDPDHPAHIEGWSEPLYNEIRQYASELGVSQQVIDNTVDPVAIKLIHKAMLYDKAQRTAMKKLSKAPKNVSKTPTNDGNATAGGSARKAMERLRKSGETDDAAEALLARWGER